MKLTTKEQKEVKAVKARLFGIDWDSRLRNKAFLILFLPFLTATIYQLLASFGLVLSVDQSKITAVGIQLVNILGLLGIVIDGTGNGLYDDTEKHINIMARFESQTFWMTFLPSLIGFVYQFLDLFGIVPKTDQSSIVDGALQVINILTLIGIVSNHTTPGFTDPKESDGQISENTNNDAEG